MGHPWAFSVPDLELPAEKVTKWDCPEWWWRLSDQGTNDYCKVVNRPLNQKKVEWGTHGAFSVPDLYRAQRKEC